MGRLARFRKGNPQRNLHLNGTMLGKCWEHRKKMVVWYCQMNISGRSTGVYSTESGPGDSKCVSVCHGSILSLFVFGSMCLGVFEIRIYRGEGIPLGHLADTPGKLNIALEKRVRKRIAHHSCNMFHVLNPGMNHLQMVIAFGLPQESRKYLPFIHQFSSLSRARFDIAKL